MKTALPLGGCYKLLSNPHESQVFMSVSEGNVALHTLQRKHIPGHCARLLLAGCGMTPGAVPRRWRGQPR